jgi:SAM-dependent methyltransferase
MLLDPDGVFRMTPTVVSQLLPYGVRHGARWLQARLRAKHKASLNPHTARQLWKRNGFKWSVGDVTLRDGNLEIRGWAHIEPADRANIAFTWNDRSFDRVEYGLPRNDLKEVMPYIDGIGGTGFRCTARLPADWPPPANHLTFRCVDGQSGRPLIDASQPFCYQIPEAGEEIPESNRRVRVMGFSPETSFRISGYTVFNQIRRALNQTVGRDLTQFGHVLDWGCGCGRVSRYFRPPVAVTGVDVDPDNVRWCQQHLPHGRFLTIPLYPPTSLPAATFDLVFGISVMTHLREATQEQWLAELDRVTRPGGIVMLTFHGDASTCLANPARQVWDQLRASGFVDTSNTVYDAALEEDGYYRNIYQTTEYVRRVWSRRFQVLDVLPYYMSHQDVAILRKA